MVEALVRGMDAGQFSGLRGEWGACLAAARRRGQLGVAAALTRGRDARREIAGRLGATAFAAAWLGAGYDAPGWDEDGPGDDWDDSEEAPARPSEGLEGREGARAGEGSSES